MDCLFTLSFCSFHRCIAGFYLVFVCFWLLLFFLIFVVVTFEGLLFDTRTGTSHPHSLKKNLQFS